MKCVKYKFRPTEIQPQQCKRIMILNPHDNCFRGYRIATVPAVQ